LRVLNTESDKSIDTIEKLVKEYDIKVGYHDHPKRPNDESYRMWDPNYILSLVKDRDPRIGSCADTGHWVRSGLKPVDCLRILKGRIMSSHLKDLHEFSRNGHDVPYGQGKSDVPGILAEFKAQKFDGPISVGVRVQLGNVGAGDQAVHRFRAHTGRRREITHCRARTSASVDMPDTPAVLFAASGVAPRDHPAHTEHRRAAPCSRRTGAATARTSRSFSNRRWNIKSITVAIDPRLGSTMPALRTPSLDGSCDALTFSRCGKVPLDIGHH
jgi:hypothetical protein